MPFLSQRVALALLVAAWSAAAWAQEPNRVQYHLALGGRYTPLPLRQLPSGTVVQDHPPGDQYRYIHGNEAPHQLFNATATPVIRWDAIVEVTGPNGGAANLVINLEVRSGAVDGPLATAASFSGDYPAAAGLNFSIGVSTRDTYWGSITDNISVGGPNMALRNTGLAQPGTLEGAGAGYTSWGGRSSVRPGVGRVTLPDGSAGLGLHPTFDGKIDISSLPVGTYWLVLNQGTGVNVLRDDVNLNNYQNSFAKHCENRPSTSLSFFVTRDADEDGVYDHLDNCTASANPTQADNDGDGAGDACDPDDDDDGVPDGSDNCALVANVSQIDVDANGVGDACQGDEDGDGVPDTVDNCRSVRNPDQADRDADGSGNACDDDLDNDGRADLDDNCPAAANPTQLDTDADGLGDACDPDGDNDGVPDANDNCPATANPDQADADQDGTGDVCDAAAPPPDDDGTPDGSDPPDDGTDPDGDTGGVTPPPGGICGLGLVEAAAASSLALLAGRRRRW